MVMRPGERIPRLNSGASKSFIVAAAAPRIYDAGFVRSACTAALIIATSSTSAWLSWD